MVLRGNKEGVAEEKERGKFFSVSFSIPPQHILSQLTDKEESENWTSPVWPFHSRWLLASPFHYRTWWNVGMADPGAAKKERPSRLRVWDLGKSSMQPLLALQSVLLSVFLRRDSRDCLSQAKIMAIWRIRNHKEFDHTFGQKCVQTSVKA